MDNVEELKLKQQVLKKQFVRLSEGFSGEMSRSEAKVKMKHAEDLWSRLETVQMQLEAAKPENVLEEDFIKSCDLERRGCEEAYLAMVTRLQFVIDEADDAQKNVWAQLSAEINNSHEDNKPVRNVQKLPEIKLPEFGGDFTKWLFFKNSFETTIHNNEQLTNVQKHQYLIGVLKGEARKVIEGFIISDSSYVSAWKLLTDTYNNDTMIIDRHLEELFQFPLVTKENKSESLRHLHWHIQTHISSLKAMRQSVEHWDVMVIHMAKKKLDFADQKDWQERTKDCTPEAMPKLEDFLKFLSERAQAYVILQPSKAKAPQSAKGKQHDKATDKVTMAATQSRCNVCDGGHPTYQCGELMAKSVEDRRKVLLDKKLCLNCLRRGHLARDCRGLKCKRCGRLHNSILHQENVSIQDSVPSTSEVRGQQNNDATGSRSTSSVVGLTRRPTSQVLLSTALVQVEDARGRRVMCRALLDSGSQLNLMTQDLCRRLRLERTETRTYIRGVDQAKADSRKAATLKMLSRDGRFQTELDCVLLPSLTESLPQMKIEMDRFTLPDDIYLADPTFNEPGHVDILIGAGLYWKLVIGPPENDLEGHPVLQNTRLGWVLGGEIANQEEEVRRTCLKVTNEQLSGQLERFWRQEAVGEQRHFTKEELACEQQFADTVSRDSTGRFIVKLPLKAEFTLGNSREQAHTRLMSLERRLIRHPDLREAYTNFMREYQKLGHMSRVQGELNPEKEAYFIPHHAILRPESKTTKVRVVFDASAKTSNGVSLNMKLLTGPNLQRDLFHILLRFRSWRYVISADVEKMYRQIQVHPEDRQLQLILWREDFKAPVDVYQLNTVTYGTASAPYHAMRCLDELANICERSSPAVAKAIREDFYMDDCLSGGDQLEEVIQLRQGLQDVLMEGQLLLRKWRSNEPVILEDLAVQNENDKLLLLDKDEASKTLGLLWDATKDELLFQVQLSNQVPRTKREVASKIAQIFDPLGLLSPVLIRGKLFMRHLWAEGLEWDETLSEDHLAIWNDYYLSWTQIESLRISRNVNFRNQARQFDLFGFSDASEKALGACIYAVYDAGADKRTAQLICSKSRVAPLKTVSLPRLELEAALLLSRLVQDVREALGDRVAQVKLWSDSTIVLGWVKTEPHFLKTFVANRVTKIREVMECYNANWSYVPSSENPADLPSRGITCWELETSQLWWQGPPWLETPNLAPVYSEDPEIELPELKTSPFVLLTTPTSELLHRFSSFTKLCRVVAYCKRFLYNCQNSNARRTESALQPLELLQAEADIIKWTQEETFSREMKLLGKGESLDKGICKSLSPFLDEYGVIRVGGRIRHSELPEENKHPALLPANHHITQILLEREHVRLRHCPPEQLLHSLRQRYWPINGRRATRKVVKRCMRCFQFNPKVPDCYMGDLPKERVTATIRPFLVVGVDYAGPISIRESSRRGRIPVTKGYIAVFTCFSTKAAHLELVSDLTTEAFLAALQRFTARRGLCTQIFSDNGRNFVGAANSLKDVQDFLQREGEDIAASLAQQLIHWSFIPPRSPHFGGLWEAAVKIMKRHLYTETQGRVLTFEQTYTLLCDIEAVLNSRPLTPLPNDPNDMSVLTPSHFLLGDSLMQPCEVDVSEKRDNVLSRYQQLRKMRRRIWQRWQHEYLQELQKRTKWTTVGPRIAEGTLVLLVEDNVPPLQWPRGRIIKVHPGPDAQVRVVTVQTANGTYTRSIKRICILPIDEDELVT